MFVAAYHDARVVRAPDEWVPQALAPANLGEEGRAAVSPPATAAASHGGRWVEEEQGALHAPRGKKQPAPPRRDAPRTVRVPLAAAAVVVDGGVDVGVGVVGLLPRNDAQCSNRRRWLWRRQQRVGAVAVARGRRGDAGLPGAALRREDSHGVRRRQEAVHHDAAADADAARRPGDGVAEAAGAAAVHGEAAVRHGERVGEPRLLIPLPHRRGDGDHRHGVARGLLVPRRGVHHRRAPGADALGMTGPRAIRPRRRLAGGATAMAPHGDERRGEVDAPVRVGHDRRRELPPRLATTCHSRCVTGLATALQHWHFGQPNSK